MNFYELNTDGMSIEEVEVALAYQDDGLDAKIEEAVNSVVYPVMVSTGATYDSASEYEAYLRSVAREQRAEILVKAAGFSSLIDVEVAYAPGYTAVTGEDDECSQYMISYHKGRMPAFEIETFDTLSELVQAMIEIAPISQWSDIEYD